MVSRMANTHTPCFFGLLIQDEIEAVRMVEKVARSRYRAFGGFFAQAAEAPPIAAERFVGGETLVADLHHAPVGFLLLRPLDGLLYVVTIAVSPDVAGLGVGRLLMTRTERRARQLKVAGLSLTTFRTPPWNGPWFHRQGYSPIPGRAHRSRPAHNLDRHATFHDMAARETLWKPITAMAKRTTRTGAERARRANSRIIEASSLESPTPMLAKSEIHAINSEPPG
jgi:GNAT superfamily N-acetyltransferase